MLVKAPEQGAHLASTAGVTVHLKSNEVRNIPKFMIPMAYTAGCMPVEGAPAEPVVEPDPSGEDRELKILLAVSTIVEANDPNAFTKTDPKRPRKNLVEAETGFTVSNEEILAAYASAIEPAADTTGDETA